MAEQAELTRPQAEDKLQTVNPATGEPGRAYAAHSIDDAKAAATAARAAFLDWRRTSFDERAVIIRKAAEILRALKDEFARLMTEEMGKTVTTGVRRSRSARSIATGSLTMPRNISATSRPTSAAAKPSSPSIRSGSCWR